MLAFSILLVLWAFNTQWTPRNDWEVLVLGIVCAVSPLGGLWVFYQAIRYEKDLLPYLLLGFLPFSFVWYYFERMRPHRATRLPVRWVNGHTE